MYDPDMASFQQRVLGVLRLDAATFEDVEHDRDATWQAAAVVAATSVTTSVGWYFGIGSPGWILRGAIHALLAWAIGSAVLWQVGTRLLPGKNTEADFGQLLRCLGFAQVPGIVGLLAVVPILGLFAPFIAAVWVIAASFIAVRQALDYDDTFRAIMVCLIAWVVSVIVFAVLGLGSSRVF